MAMPTERKCSLRKFSKMRAAKPTCLYERRKLRGSPDGSLKRYSGILTVRGCSANTTLNKEL
jgi:hypothetical protein